MGGAGLLVAALVGLYLLSAKPAPAPSAWTCEECYQNFLLYGIEHASWEPHQECKDCDWESLMARAQAEAGPVVRTGA